MTIEMEGLVREEREDVALEPQDNRIEDILIAPAQSADDDLQRVEDRAVDEASDERAFSRDLLDTYFHQMGGGALLTRDEEVALAKRIEAAQLAVLRALCGVPMLVERIDGWGNELRAGRMPVRDLIDLSMYGAAAGSGADDAVEPGSQVADEDGAPGGDAGLPAAVSARLDCVFALAREIASI